MADFAETIATAYAVDGAALDLGRGVHDGAVAPAAVVRLPLRMVNRHGQTRARCGASRPGRNAEPEQVRTKVPGVKEPAQGDHDNEERRMSWQP
jgi:uncharacterized protein